MLHNVVVILEMNVYIYIYMIFICARSVQLHEVQYNVGCTTRVKNKTKQKHESCATHYTSAWNVHRNGKIIRKTSLLLPMKFIFNVSSDHPGSHPDDPSVSVLDLFAPVLAQMYIMHSINVQSWNICPQGKYSSIQPLHLGHQWVPEPVRLQLTVPGSHWWSDYRHMFHEAVWYIGDSRFVLGYVPSRVLQNRVLVTQLIQYCHSEWTKCVYEFLHTPNMLIHEG